MFNQVTEWYSINDIAEKVQRVGGQMGLDVQAHQIPNPRVESENHYYNVVHTKLLDLGLEPHLLNDEEIEGMIRLALQHRDRIDERLIKPTVNWRSTANQVTQAAVAQIEPA